jgi:hypothetical protein
MTNFIFGVDNGGKIGLEQNKSFLVGKFLKIPKNEKKFVEFQKIKTTIMIEGMLLFQNAL